MIVTESEAMKKYCPFKITAATARHMQEGDSNGLQFCYASDCMAWVWEYEIDPDPATRSYSQTGNGWCGLVRR